MAAHQGLFSPLICICFTAFLASNKDCFVTSAPVITPFKVINLHEDTKVQTALVAVNCTDTAATDNRCATCNYIEIKNDLDITVVTSFNPGFNRFGGPFDIFRLNNQFIGNLEFVVVFVPNQGTNLDYSLIRTYFIKIECKNAAGTAGPAVTLEIDILPNQSPVIIGAPSASVSLDARNGPTGSFVYDVNVIDNDTDTITYKMTVQPSFVDLFQINQQDGIITLAKNLLTAVTSVVTLQILVNDGHHKDVGPLTLTVNITNLNSRPSVRNLPINITINENAAPGTLITTLTIDDPDIFQTLTPVLSVNPVSEAAKFVFLPGTKQLRLAQQTVGQPLLDAETVSSMNLSFSIFDGHLASVNEYISLTVANINEPPFFSRPVHFCTLLEANQFGSSCDLSLTIRDPEGDIILSPSLNPANNSQNFILSNGFLRINNDYTVDGGLFATISTLTIQVSDDKGATGTSLIQVNVLDQNTKTPQFVGSGQTSVVITENVLTPPAILTTITATDGDLTSPNNDVTLRLQASINLGNNVIFTPQDGRVTYLNRFAASKDCSDCRLEIIAFDGGSPARTATTTFYVSFVTTTSTTTTTTTPTTTVSTTATTTVTTTQANDLLTSPGGAAVLGILIALLVLLFLAVVGYFLYRYCKYGTCCGPTSGPGAAGSGGNGGVFGNCCGGQPDNQVKVRPEGPDYGQARTPPGGYRGENVYKSSKNYKDDFWNTNDGYNDFNRPRSIKSVRIGGLTPPGGGTMRALPAGRPY